MAAPTFTPAGGVGTVSNGYRYTGPGTWTQIASQAQPRPTGGGQVLGRDTMTTTAAGSPVPAPAPSGGDGGNGGGGESDFNSEIDSLYNPTISYLSQREGELGQQKAAQEGVLEQEFGVQSGRVEARKGEAMEDLSSSEDKFRKVLESALAEATKAYNALNQQRMARFGGGSSAGGAVGELAQQEFFRQQGSVAEKGLEGEQEFGKERVRTITQFSEMAEDVASQKKKAITDLTQRFQDAVSQINQQRTMIDSEKQQAKLNALQAARGIADKIYSEEKAQLRQIALGFVDSMQQAAGRAFTPQEISTHISEFMSQLPGALGMGAVNTTATAAPVYTKQSGQEEDELAQLSPLG